MKTTLAFSFLSVLFIGMSLTLNAADGDLDPSFGIGGKVTTEFLGNNAAADAIALDSAGRIVAAGGATAGGTDFAVARYNPDGTLDSSFGGTGKATIDFGTNETAWAVATGPLDDKIVVAGTSGIFPDRDFVLARLNPDGTLDSTFGSGGRLTMNVGSSATDDGINGVAIDSAGKIVVGGFSQAGAVGENFVIARFNSDGTLDTSFFSGGPQPGVRIVDFGLQDDYIEAIKLDDNGRILAAGFTVNGLTSDIAIARLNADGTLDSSFGAGGKVTTDINAGSYDVAYAMNLQTDGKIVLAGYIGNMSGAEVPFVLRYNSDGTLDSSFGSGGVTTIDLGSGYGYFFGVAVQDDGKIVAAGQINNSDILLVQLNTDGTLDAAFGDAGILSTDFNGGSDRAKALLLQSDGRIVTAGSSGLDFALARFGCLFCDDFETLSVDPSKWTVVKPDFSQSGGNLVGTPTGKKALAEGTGFSGCTNCTFEITMSSDGGASNKLFFYSWYVDKKNTVEVLMKQENGKFVLKQLAGGVTAAKEKALVTINPGQFYKVKVIYDGTTFTLNIDGADVASIPATGTPFGTAALAVKNTTGRFGYITSYR